MSTASPTVTQEAAPRKAVGEWIWRFLAAVMLFAAASNAAVVTSIGGFSW